MNPEAEKLRHAMSVVEIKWLQDNADTVAELVDAALDLAACGPCRVSRLYRAADAFKGPQGPPEPQRKSIEALLCPEEGCNWGGYIHPHEASDAMEHYRRHHHTDHGGRP